MRRPALTLAFVVASLCGCAGDDPVQMNPPDPIQNAAEAIQALTEAYRTEDYHDFAALLANDYAYFLNAPDPETGETQYDRATELRIHQRLFDPANIPPGDPLPPSAVGLQQVSIAMSQQSDFTERQDLYTNATPPGPLDPTRWIATEATYDASVFLQMQGETDYQLNGRCQFIVLENRTKAIGDAGKFTIYHWVDLDGATTTYRLPYR